ncbi:MAG: metal ABC transporter substrate-binding protein [Planctomycetaceae bacterium]
MLLCAAVLFLITGCVQQAAPTESSAATQKKPQIIAASYPLAYFAERIGGELTDVTFSVPADIDPADWQPDATAIASVQSADLILLNGAGYEKWAQRATLPLSRTLVTTRGVQEKLIPLASVVTHQHGPQGDKSNSDVASFTWLDPQIAIAQAHAIREELLRLLPEQAETLNRNFETLDQDLQRLDQDLKTALANVAAKKWLAKPPIFQYLQRRYGLNMKNAELDMSAAASHDDWSQLVSYLKENPAEFLLCETDPSPAETEHLRSLGIHVVVFRPLGNRPATGDYLTAMCTNLEQLRRAVDARNGQH